MHNLQILLTNVAQYKWQKISNQEARFPSCKVCGASAGSLLEILPILSFSNYFGKVIFLLFVQSLDNRYTEQICFPVTLDSWLIFLCSVVLNFVASICIEL